MRRIRRRCPLKACWRGATGLAGHSLSASSCRICGCSQRTRAGSGVGSPRDSTLLKTWLTRQDGLFSGPPKKDVLPSDPVLHAESESREPEASSKCSDFSAQEAASSVRVSDAGASDPKVLAKVEPLSREATRKGIAEGPNTRTGGEATTESALSEASPTSPSTANPSTGQGVLKGASHGSQRSQGRTSARSEDSGLVREKSQKPQPATEPLPSKWLSTIRENAPSTRKPARYSSALVSGMVHFVMLLGLGIYTIKAFEEPELMAITASALDTEMVAMHIETPIETPVMEQAAESLTTESIAAPSSDLSLGLNVDIGEGPTPIGEESALTQAMKDLPASSLGMGAQLANAEFFGVKAEGNTFCYLVDKSPSMKQNGAFQAAVMELVRSLESMKPTQRFYIWFFSKELDALTLGEGAPEKYPVYATPENIQRAKLWIQSIRIADGASPNQALSEAIAMEPDGIFLLFDGDTRVDVAKHLRKVNRVDDVIQGSLVRVPIHTLGFYTQEFEALMRSVAEENLGTYRFVPPPVTIKRRR